MLRFNHSRSYTPESFKALFNVPVTKSFELLKSSITNTNPRPATAPPQTKGLSESPNEKKIPEAASNPLEKPDLLAFYPPPNIVRVSSTLSEPQPNEIDIEFATEYTCQYQDFPDPIGSPERKPKAITNP